MDVKLFPQPSTYKMIYRVLNVLNSKQPRFEGDNLSDVIQNLKQDHSVPCIL